MTNAACNIPRDGRGVHVPHNVVVVVGGTAPAMSLLCSPSIVIDVRHLVVPLITTSTSMWSSRTTILNELTRGFPPSDVWAHDAPPAAAVPPPLPSLLSSAAQESRTRIENIAPKNDAQWRGVAPSPPPHHRPASHRLSRRPPPHLPTPPTSPHLS